MAIVGVSGVDIADVDASVTSPATPTRNIFGHPRGLLFLAGTEFWDRISFHGMQAVLVLYMVDQLLRPGHIEQILGFGKFRAALESVTGGLSDQALATQTFGLYIGFTYLTPVIGGYIGDRWIGRRRGVGLGALLMTAGHACMAFDATFLIALALLVSGAGFLRGNLAAQIGMLYPEGDRRRPVGFQIYYSLLNTGIFIAPLVIGTLAVRYDYHLGLGLAGIGMLIGLILYLSGSGAIPTDVPHAARAAPTPMTPDERRVVATLLLLLPIAVLFWIAQAQIWNTYNLWARDHVDLVVAGFAVPVPWLQALDSFCVVLLLPPLLWLWRRQAAQGREPDELGKLALGCLIFAVAVSWLAFTGPLWPHGATVPLLWVLGFHLFSNIGYLYFAPTAVALVSRVAPARVNAMMIGVYFLSIFAGSTISGRMGGFYETLPPAGFWLLHAGAALTGGVLLLALRGWLRRRLEGSAESTLSSP
jgi:POT family proton-dependent oligopeptide transporter